jgi:dienelactone hydrolase
MGQNNTPSATNIEYLAKPSGACCLKGTIHKGESRGSWTEVAGVETYIATPPAEKANGNILLYFPDVWGMFPNGLLVMDAFADAGYLTLGLDYFRGVSRHEIHAMESEMFSFADKHGRTQYGNIARTATIIQTRTSITKHGKRSTQLSQM